MNILPIIIRELRAEARHRANYSLRMFGAALSTLLLGFFLWGNPDAQSGGSAFGILNFAVFCTVWIVVPLITADCLSREKREGTLGLLFLTPLKPIEIILGKGTIHALRSLTLLIAVIPIMTIPFILGGITKSDVLWSLLFNLSALLLALAAGLLASSLCQQWTRAVILAAIFAATFAIAFLEIVTASFFSGTGAPVTLLHKLQMLLHLFSLTRAQMLSSGYMPPPNQILSVSSSLLVTATLICLLVLLFAASRLKKSWQDSPPTSRQVWLQKTFCTPRFWVGFLHRRSQSQLTRNPIGWLQQYSWSARISKWGWCAVVITIVSWFLAAGFGILQTACIWLKTALFVSVAFSAVGSFQREKQNGALELLLVTPLREKQIILGRLWGIWGQFLPAFGILLLSVAAVPDYVEYHFGRRANFSMVNAIGGFIVVPIVGLYFALQIKNFFVAWLLTCGLTLVLPQFAVGLWMKFIYSTGGRGIYSAEFFQTMTGAQNFVLTIVGLFAARFLYLRLKNRTFALAR